MYRASFYRTATPGTTDDSDFEAASTAWRQLAQVRAAHVAPPDLTLRRLTDMAEYAMEFPKESCGVIHGPTDPLTGNTDAYWVREI